MNEVAHRQWATGCATCDDYPTRRRDEDEARDQAVRLQLVEDRHPDPHRIVVLTRWIEAWSEASPSSPSATTTDEPAPSLPDAKGQEP